jgi:hypothetical protein
MSRDENREEVNRSLTDDTDDEESDDGRVVTDIVRDLSVGVYAMDQKQHQRSAIWTKLNVVARSLM